MTKKGFMNKVIKQTAKELADRVMQEAEEPHVLRSGRGGKQGHVLRSSRGIGQFPSSGRPGRDVRRQQPNYQLSPIRSTPLSHLRRGSHSHRIYEDMDVDLSSVARSARGSPRVRCSNCRCYGHEASQCRRSVGFERCHICNERNCERHR